MCEYVIKEYTTDKQEFDKQHMLRLLYQIIEGILSTLYLHM